MLTGTLPVLERYNCCSAAGLVRRGTRLAYFHLVASRVCRAALGFWWEESPSSWRPLRPQSLSQPVNLPCDRTPTPVRGSQGGSLYPVDLCNGRECL